MKESRSSSRSGKQDDQNEAQPAVPAASVPVHSSNDYNNNAVNVSSNQNQHRLLHLSNFAKPLIYKRNEKLTTLPRQRRRRSQLLQSHGEEEHGQREKETMEEQIMHLHQCHEKEIIHHSPSRFYVNVKILNKLPDPVQIYNQCDIHVSSSLSGDKRYNDEYATIYTPDIELLHGLQIFDGGICFLSRDEDCHGRIMKKKSNSNKESSRPLLLSSPVILRLLSLPLSSSKKKKISNKRNFQVYIPPTIAATIGIHTTTIGRTGGICYLHCPNEQIIIHHATKAQLIEIAKPPYDHLVTFEKLMLVCHCHNDKNSNHNDNDTIINSGMIEDRNRKAQDDALKSLFFSSTTTPTTSSFLNSSKSEGEEEQEEKQYCFKLVTHGSLIVTLTKKYPMALYPYDHHNHKTSNRDDDDNNYIHRYYKVIHLEGNHHYSTATNYTTTAATLRNQTYWLSPKTELTLIQSGMKVSGYTHPTIYDHPIHRIPQSSIMYSFISSLENQRQRNNRETLEVVDDDDEDDQTHVVSVAATAEVEVKAPSLSFPDQLANRIISIWNNRSDHQYGSMEALTSQVLKIIGDNEILISSCINIAADKVGMNVMHIHGLSAFLFRQRMYTSNNNKNKPTLNITGSLVDKLNGIKLACEIARKSSPCILHISLNGELVNYDNDDVSFDEQNRLLSMMKEQLIESTRNVMLFDDIPPMFLILSTKKNFPRDGPIASSLINDSFIMDVDNDCKQSLHKEQQSKSSTSSTLIPNIKWEDVGGLSHVREEIMDAIELPLKYPHLFGKSKRSGILLYGPPGTGKTLVAKAVATECGLPFISVKGPELLGSYVGESEGNIRTTFESARSLALEGNGAILFFDEIDSLAPRRGGLGDGGGVMERVVASFLVEIDKDTSIEFSLDKSYDESKKKEVSSLFVIGATNRPDLLDPSLLRPGRFDRLVYLGVTTKREDRISILSSQTRKFTFENDISSHTMAESVIDHIPEKISGADFSAICNNALMLAVKRLCNQADDEINKLMADLNCNEKPKMEKVLSQWSKDQCTPRVSRDDIISAAKDIVPIIKDEDLKRYDELRRQFER